MGVASKLLSLKWILSVTLPLAALTCSACGPKAPYSDIKTDQTGGLASQDNKARHEVVATMPPTPSTPIHPPSFVDAAGQIKDLPMYPGARLETKQYGAIGGYDTMMTRSKSGAPYDRVITFYEDVIKRTGWTVSSDSRATDSNTWQLAKGADDTAQLSVAKGTGNNSVYITISRSKRQVGAAPQTSPQPEGSK